MPWFTLVLLAVAIVGAIYLAKAVPSSKPVLWKVAIVIGVLLAVVFLFRFSGIAEWATYEYAFRVLTTEGGMNAWLARAVALLLSAAVSFGVAFAFSLNKRRRTIGWAVITGSFVAFFLLMYACTRSYESPLWVGKDPDGRLVVFAHGGRGPNGEELTPMTPEIAKQLKAQDRAEAEEQEKQAKAEADNREKQAKSIADDRFRKTYVNVNDPAFAPGAPAPKVVLAIKAEGSDAEGNSLRGWVAQLLKEKKKNVYNGAFKPAFYTGGPFEDLWNGDQSVLERLRLLEGASGWVLLGKVRLSQPEKTGIEGLVSVPGTLSIMLVNSGGQNGPWDLRAAGAGVNAAEARANAVKRLMESIDVDAIFK
jgi:hypothetical protein